MALSDATLSLITDSAQRISVRSRVKCFKRLTRHGSTIFTFGLQRGSVFFVLWGRMSGAQDIERSHVVDPIIVISNQRGDSAGPRFTIAGRRADRPAEPVPSLQQNAALHVPTQDQ
jgi:hypothetical protein